MLVKHHAKGKFYLIACPEASRIVRRSDRIARRGGFLPDLIVVPFGRKEIPIPADPPELLPLLAEAGRFGLSLAGEPMPDFRLAGVACPGCGERDVNWLSVEDAFERIHCDYCGVDFDPTVAARIVPERGDIRGRLESREP
jgi:Zn ribbon nucleic-acid-binding protein